MMKNFGGIFCSVFVALACGSVRAAWAGEAYDVTVTSAGTIFNVVGHTSYQTQTTGDFEADCFARFADGYASTGQYGGFPMPIKGGAAAHNGQQDSYPDGFGGGVHAYYSYSWDMNSPEMQTLGPASEIYVSVDKGFNDTTGKPVIGFTESWGGHPDPPANFTHGAVLIEARTTTDGHAFTPATGATVQMWVNAAFAKPGSPGAMVPRSSTAVHYLYGTSDQTGSKSPDSPFPSGMQSDTVVIAVTYKGTTKTYNTNGAAFAYHAVTYVFDFGASSGASPTVYVDANKPPDGVDPTTGGSDGTGTGSGGGLFDLDAFKAMLVDLFVPKQADLDALKAAAMQFMGWGPLSIPGQVKAMYLAAFGTTNLDDADPNYWALNLDPWHGGVSGAGATGLGNSMPTGYHQGLTDPDVSPDIQARANLWSSFFPTSLDLSQYRREIVSSRSAISLFLWGVFIIGLIAWAKPKVQL